MNGNANRGELDKSAESRHARVTDRRLGSCGRRGQLSHSGAMRCNGEIGSGGRIWAVPSVPQAVRVK